ncbi:MAG: hypothetical protein Q9226_000731 [Calogaya cf. arnoldii]
MSSSNPTATLDSKAREAINEGLMDQETLCLLQDAGEACKQARTGEHLSARVIESIRHYFQSFTTSDIQEITKVIKTIIDEKTIVGHNVTGIATYVPTEAGPYPFRKSEKLSKVIHSTPKNADSSTIHLS